MTRLLALLCWLLASTVALCSVNSDRAPADGRAASLGVGTRIQPADIEFRRQQDGALRAPHGLSKTPGENLYDPRTGKGLTRNPALNAYRPVHIGDALVGLEAGFVNGIWQSMAAPIVDGMLKSRGLTNLNPAQQAIADRFLNPVQFDQDNPIQRSFSISGTGAAMAGMAWGGVRSIAPARFHRHHPIPKFMGGDSIQSLYRLTPEQHIQFHRMLRMNLKSAGIPLNVGGRGGSRNDWLRYFDFNPGSENAAYDALLDTSRSFDRLHGTDITRAVWRNLLTSRQRSLP